MLKQNDVLQEKFELNRKVKVTVKEDDGRKKNKRVLIGQFIEAYPNHLLFLSDKNNIRESFMLKDLEAGEVECCYIN